MRCLLFLLLAGVLGAAEPLTRMPRCKYVATRWADGDSFRVKTADGELHTVRLYGADCIEAHVADTTDARRLRAQRRYFGISDYGGTPQASITAAKALGEEATACSRSLLSRPFTLHTAFADGRGSGKYKRIYGFVTLADGRDLASELVRRGLARAYGVYRRTPRDEHADDYRETLKDFELQAASRGLGAWKLTDWDRLPEERRLERVEAAEMQLAIRGAEIEAGSIDPNTATRDELMQLPGIGEVTANRIIEARPFGKATDLRKVQGIGDKTLEGIRPFLKMQ